VLRTWKSQLLARHQPTTVHKYLSRLGVVLRVAVEDYAWLTDNPIARVKQPSPGSGRVRFLTPEERQRLLMACQQSRNPHLYHIVVVALGTGGRRNEIVRLQWPQVDLDAAIVRFLRTKTKVDRAVPLTGEALEILRTVAQQRTPTTSWVFPTWGGKRPTPIESPWQTAREAAGLDDFHFHDLRHTFASYCAMSGATLREIAEVLGHKNIQETMKYSHLTHSRTRGVVEKMHEHILQPEETPDGRL